MKFVEKICAACLTSFLVCAIVSQAIPQSGFTRAPKTNAKDAEILTADSQS
uniref:Uncharacterized protein n=1 Tax=Plectus sambesii TaxID=2011161 RepID=A0A914VTU4_9BILA